MFAAVTAPGAAIAGGIGECLRARATTSRSTTAADGAGRRGPMRWCVRPTSSSICTHATTPRSSADDGWPSSRSSIIKSWLSSSSSSPSSSSVSRRQRYRRRRWSLARRANGSGAGGDNNFDEATREEFRKMGVGADEDEFGPGVGGGGYGIGAGFGAENVGTVVQDYGEEDEEDEEENRIFRNASMEQNNDIVSRFANLLKYILVIRCGSELPMRHFDIPTDAGVGGNVFSQFISSIVPVDVASASTAAGLPTGIPYFHVGIGPFIAASIAMQVLIAVVPSLKELSKDAVGTQTLKQYTRYLMFVVAIVQSFVTASELRPYTTLTSNYYLQVVPVFITGACVVSWLADEMTNYGIGSGTSVMITMSVCGAYFSVAQYYAAAFLASATVANVAPFVAAAVILTAGSVLVQTGTCKVPLLYFQGPSIPGLPRVVREEIDHIPFKVNPLGMQPVLVAVFLCEGMTWLSKQLGCPAFFQAFVDFFFSSSSWMYYVTFFLIVFGFSYLDLQDTPKEVSEYMVKIGARIPDVRPGERTERYLGELQDGSRFFGGALLGTVAVCCTAMDNYMKATTGMCIGFTSMLIVTSTILQMKRQVSALAQMPKLDKVMKSL